MLAQAGVPLREHDFFKRRLSVEELRALLAGRRAADLFSWKSVLARQRGYQPGTLDDETMLQLMVEQPTLIRRPFAIVKGRLVVGSDVAKLRPPDAT